MKLERRNTALFYAFAVLLLGAAVALVYGQTLGFGFIAWDDEIYVTRNTLIGSLDAAHLGRIFTSFHFTDYLPLNLLSLALDRRLWGLDAGGYHLTNTLLHLVNSLLCLVFLRRLGASEAAGLLGALLFAVHPLNVEVVAWVSQRKSLLCFFFMLLAWLAHGRARGGGPARLRRPWYWASLVLFLLALASKSAAVVLPVLLVLQDMTLERKPWRASLADKAPFFALAAVFGVLTILSQRHGGVAMEPHGGLPAHAAGVLMVVPWYLVKLVLPAGLSAVYPELLPRSALDPRLWGAGAFLAAAAWLWVRAGGRFPRARFAAGWFIVSLLPVLNLVPLPIMRADRYLYLPMPGLMLLAALAADGAWKALAASARAPLRRYGPAALCLAGLALAASLGYASWGRAPAWRDAGSLWRSILTVYPGSALARAGLGALYVKEGRYPEAVRESRLALQYRPGYPQAHNNLGIVLLRQGKLEEAEAELRAALRAKPDYPEAVNNLGLVSMRGRDYPRALERLKQAVAMDPANADWRFNLALVYFLSGEEKRGMETFNALLALDPSPGMQARVRKVLTGWQAVKEGRTPPP